MCHITYNDEHRFSDLVIPTWDTFYYKSYWQLMDKFLEPMTTNIIGDLAVSEYYKVIIAKKFSSKMESVWKYLHNSITDPISTLAVYSQDKEYHPKTPFDFPPIKGGAVKTITLKNTSIHILYLTSKELFDYIKETWYPKFQYVLQASEFNANPYHVVKGLFFNTNLKDKK